MIAHLNSNFDLLHQYSESLPYGMDEKFVSLYRALKEAEEKFHFPAVKDDVGSFLSFLSKSHGFETVFEFGSGYGQSAFWFLKNNPKLTRIYLTEKRDDMQAVFESMPWPEDFFSRMDYYQGDAFQKVNEVDSFDLLLIDGVKADYLKFVQIAEKKLSPKGLVVIDNAFWRGSFLDQELVEKKVSAQNMKALHDYIKASSFWDAQFLPFSDGVILLSRKV